MTILEWLLSSMKKLSEAGVDSPRRDCLVLVEDLLGKDRSWVTAHAETELSAEQVKKLDAWIKRRVNREPLAYIRGRGWFWGRFFKVGPEVLVPRPETESFIEFLKEMKPKNIIDIGTGSGCLAISAKLELPEAKVAAIDIDSSALKIAKENARTYKTEIDFIKGSLLEPLASLPMKPDTAIMANLPYVPDGSAVSAELKYEPKLAWSAGKDGLDYYIEFWKQLKGIKHRPEYILTEARDYQHKALLRLAGEAGYELVKTDILVQLFKRT